MKKFFDKNNFTIYNDDSLKILEDIKENSVDAIICDPPYEIGFMSRGWDRTGIAFNIELWKKCLQVLKPGGVLIAFGGSKTFHRVACAIEDAGFDMKDTLMWLYGSGMPKGTDVSKLLSKRGSTDAEKWKGWNTQLKPMYEPIIFARKPISEKGIIENVQKWGTGAINIDECRTPFVNEADEKESKNKNQHADFGSKPPINNTVLGDYSMMKPKNYDADGRFPGNVLIGSEVDESLFPNNKSEEGGATRFFVRINEELDDEPRFYYGGKAQSKDRDEGCDNIQAKGQADTKGNGLDRVCEFCGETQLSGKCKCENKSWINKLKKNNHPCVKPTDLLMWLIKLVCAKDAVILDCFMGSGSTGKAVAVLNKTLDKNYKFIGIELDEHYCEIAKARIEYAEQNKTYVEGKKQTTKKKATLF